MSLKLSSRYIVWILDRSLVSLCKHSSTHRLSRDGVNSKITTGVFHCARNGLGGEFLANVNIVLETRPTIVYTEAFFQTLLSNIDTSVLYTFDECAMYFKYFTVCDRSQHRILYT